MVKQADGWESRLTAEEHLYIAELHRRFAEGATMFGRGVAWVTHGDIDALKAEFHEACADGRTVEDTGLASE